MSTEIEDAGNNFPNGVIPPKMLMFYEFASENTGCELFQYETISDCRQYLSPLIKDDLLNEFIPFYVDGSHSVFAIWVLLESKDFEALLIVYIDSEGLYTVCASNFDEFIQKKLGFAKLMRPQGMLLKAHK